MASSTYSKSPLGGGQLTALQFSSPSVPVTLALAHRGLLALAVPGGLRCAAAHCSITTTLAHWSKDAQLLDDWDVHRKHAWIPALAQFRTFDFFFFFFKQTQFSGFECTADVIVHETPGHTDLQC